MELQLELSKFKETITNKYKFNPYNIIYLRLSKLDNKLEKEEQIIETINKLKADFEGLLLKYLNLKDEGFYLAVEVKSAYKNSTRDEFINIYDNYLFNDISSVKDILENKPIINNKNLYIASFDRLSRVFLYGLTFQLLRKLRGINILTLLEDERIFEKKNKNILEKDNLEQTMFIFQLMLFSSNAQKHSEDMSNKIKKRVIKSKGVTISSKTGKKWGKAKSITDVMRKKIKDRFKRFTAKEIREQKDIFQTTKGTRKKIAVNTILSILRE